jgi:hypothetical protein
LAIDFGVVLVVAIEVALKVLLLLEEEVFLEGAIFMQGISGI